MGAFLATSLVACLGAILQGTIGFGLGMLASPVLVLIDPNLVPGPLLSAALLLAILVAARERRGIDLRGAGWALAGRLPGTVLGAAALVMVPARATSLLIGTLVLLAVFLVGSGLSLARTRPALVGAGALSGFMATTSSIGGPAIALLYHDEAGERVRGTLSGFFAVGLVFSLAALALVGRFGAREIGASLSLLPGVVVGFLVSGKVAPLLDRGYIRRAVLTASALAGVLVILRAL